MCAKDLLFKDGQKVVFIGDSITDCGRRLESAPYGNGYVKLAIDLITAKYPQNNITFINEGIGGNTVEDLRNRWHDDLLAHKPDWVSIKIGINDLHQHLAGTIRAVPPEKYEKLYRECIENLLKEKQTNLILIDPFYISTDVSSGSLRSRVLELLPEYLKIVEKLAGEFNAIHVRTHDKFQEQLSCKQADYFCPEPVHPYLNGHMVIAYALLEAIGW